MAANLETNTAAHRRLGPALALGLLTAALLLIFRADLFAGADLYFKAYRDVNPLTASYPWSRLELASWQQGLFPLWNPYNLLGHPLLANYQSAVFSVLLWPLVFAPLEAVVVPYLLARLLLAGMGAYLFARRLKTSPAGATAAALAFGLTGYLTQYVNDQHLVIDLLLPFLLLTADLLLRERKTKYLFAHTAVTALILLGGQPGSALFTLALGYGYAIFVGLTNPDKKLSASAPVIAAGAGAVIIALIQLLPFLEFIPRAWTFHTPGFGAEHLPPAGLLTLVAPGFFGPLDVANRHILLLRLAPYLGAVPAILAAAAALRPRTTTQAFFTAVLVIGLGLVAGAPPFSWLGQLPGLAALSFIKYTQPLIAFSAAILAGAMVDELCRGRGNIRALIVAAVLTAALLAAGRVLGPQYSELCSYMNGATIIAVCFAGAIAVIALGPKTKAPRVRAAAILALMFLDLVLASVVNRPFMFENMARKDLSAFRELVKDEPLARVAATADVLLPNQNLLVPMFDIGDHDALIPRESKEMFQGDAGLSEVRFEQKFMVFHSLRADDEDLFKISPVQYVISRVPQPPNRAIKNIVDHGWLITVSSSHSYYTRQAINGDFKGSLFAHPPGRWEISRPDLEDNPAPTSWSFSAGISEKVWNAPGDGVWFSVVGRERESGRARLDWVRYLDPRIQVSEREWIGPVNVTPNPGPLAFATLPGNNPDQDWAFWGDIRDVPDRYNIYREIKGLKIYRVHASNPPRAYLETPFHREGASVEILQYGLQAVRCGVDTGLNQEGYLVLEDAYYPGWNAYVNGEERPIGRTNHAVRGVEVPAGKSQIVFVYEPWSFRVGLWSALTALAAALALAGARAIRRPTSRPAPRNLL